MLGKRFFNDFKKGGFLMKMKRQEYFGIVAFSNLLWFFAFSVCGSSFAAPAADFPRKEITIIVNFGPGGARDILARGVGNTMSKYLGVPVVVMNQPGAGGARGLISVYHAAPDGYTIGIGATTDIIDQTLEKRDYDNKTFS
jgi:tripartite-type tricarboxylate transporter receptor subunit TctC